MADADPDLDRVVRRLTENPWDSGAWEEAWLAFWPYVVTVARQRLSVGLDTDAEDVAVEAFFAAAQRMQAGQVVLQNAEQFKRFLGSVAIRKVIDAFRRSGARPPSLSLDQAGGGTLDPVDPAPSPMQVAAFCDSYEAIRSVLDQQEGTVFDLLLLGYTVPEIATSVRTSERTAARLLRRVRLIASRFLNGSDAPNQPRAGG
jgi:DNA-directed RNA polymerase specialized sigma24 family protein